MKKNEKSVEQSTVSIFQYSLWPVISSFYTYLRPNLNREQSTFSFPLMYVHYLQPLTNIGKLIFVNDQMTQLLGKQHAVIVEGMCSNQGPFIYSKQHINIVAIQVQIILLIICNITKWNNTQNKL